MWSDDDGYAGSADTYGEGDGAGPERVQDPEVWMDYYSEDLLDLWYWLKERCESRGFAILDTCKFPDFAQFCFQFSSGYPPPV